MNVTEQIDIKSLNWNKDTLTFSEEASTLGLGHWPRHISVNNHKTKKSRVFTLLKIHKDAEQETTHAEYVPDGRERILYPEIAGTKLLIWND